MRGTTLKEFYNDALRWFFSHDSDSQEFLAGVVNGKVMSVQISGIFADKISDLSSAHKVSEARIVYTALRRYLDALKN